MTGEFFASRVDGREASGYDIIKLRQSKGLMIDGATPFNETVVAEFTPEIELDSSSGLSEILRDDVTETGSGAVGEDQGLFTLSTGATASSTAILRSAERGRYQPGSIGIAGIGLMRASAPTGDQAWAAGYYDANNGVQIGEDATGVFFRLLRGGSTISTAYQSDWNVDTADGSGGSGRTIDLTRITIVRFHILWYGSGPIECYVALEGSDGRVKETLCHVFEATAGAPIVEQPKLNISAEVENGATTSDFVLYVGGRQFGIFGRYSPNLRITSQASAFSVSVGTASLVPLVSLRKKSADISKSVKLNGTGVITSNTVKFYVIVGGTLTGASWGALDYHDANETSLERDVSATAISGGSALFGGLGTGTNQSRTGGQEFFELGVDIPDESIVTLAAIAESANTTVTGMLRLTEEW